MLSSVVLGRFFPGQSLVHRLDPRLKIAVLAVFIVLVFSARNYLALVCLLAALLCTIRLSGVPLRLYIKSTKMVLFVAVLTSILNLFWAQGVTLLTLGPLKITDQGLNNSIFVSVRLFLLIIGSSMLTFTTSPTTLALAIESLMRPLKILRIDPHEFAMMMTIALRFVPLLLEQADKIIDAQKSRGARFDEGNIFRRLKAMIPVLVPLFVLSLRSAEDLAMAMECRCYRGGEGRTSLQVLKLSRVDFVCSWMVLGFCLVVVFSNFLLPAVAK